MDWFAMQQNRSGVRHSEQNTEQNRNQIYCIGDQLPTLDYNEVMNQSKEKHINGVSINFPHPQPYTVQRKYMEKVVECLQDSKNGVLESPTGTEKTLSLLCSSLAWLQQKKDEAQMLQVSINSGSIEHEPGNETLNVPLNESTVKIPRIIYASRTHTQLIHSTKKRPALQFTDEQMK